MALMGRPRQFDRDTALASAMHLFWENGYETTSLSQLKTELGISAPSFYAAFGSKEALFHETVTLYLQRHGRVMECLWDSQLAPRAAIEKALRDSARMQCEDGHPKGCMVALNVMSPGSPEKKVVTAALTAAHARNRAGLLACVRRGIEQRELASSTNPEALAAAFESFLIGLSPLVREGTSPANLEAAITNILQLWDCARR